MKRGLEEMKNIWSEEILSKFDYKIIPERYEVTVRCKDQEKIIKKLEQLDGVERVNGAITL